MNELLKISIKNLYTTFSKYKGNPNMTGSPLYGDLDKWNKSLFSGPLETLTSEDLSRFAGKVISTWGDTNDLKHFLPRLFELTALLQTPYDIWILYQKLYDGNFELWDSQEQKAVNEFSYALFDNLISDNSEKAEAEFNDYFSALAHFYISFDDLAALWMVNNSFSSIKHLTNYIYNEAHYIFGKNAVRGNTKSTNDLEVLQHWLLSDGLIQKLTNAFYDFEKTELAEKISWVVKILEGEKSSRQHSALHQADKSNRSSS
jgi:hypothetical protein